MFYELVFSICNYNIQKGNFCFYNDLEDLSLYKFFRLAHYMSPIHDIWYAIEKFYKLKQNYFVCLEFNIIKCLRRMNSNISRLLFASFTDDRSYVLDLSLFSDFEKQILRELSLFVEA